MRILELLQTDERRQETALDGLSNTMAFRIRHPKVQDIARPRIRAY